MYSCIFCQIFIQRCQKYRQSLNQVVWNQLNSSSVLLFQQRKPPTLRVMATSSKLSTQFLLGRLAEQEASLFYFFVFSFSFLFFVLFLCFYVVVLLSFFLKSDFPEILEADRSLPFIIKFQLCMLHPKPQYYSFRLFQKLGQGNIRFPF